MVLTPRMMVDQHSPHNSSMRQPSPNNKADFATQLQQKLNQHNRRPSQPTSSQQLIADFDYEAADDQQLSFKEFDSFELVQPQPDDAPDGWTYVKAQQSASIGWIPSNYVLPVETTHDATASSDAHVVIPAATQTATVTAPHIEVSTIAVDAPHSASPTTATATTPTSASSSSPRHSTTHRSKQQSVDFSSSRPITPTTKQNGLHNSTDSLADASEVLHSPRNLASDSPALQSPSHAQITTVQPDQSSPAHKLISTPKHSLQPQSSPKAQRKLQALFDFTAQVPSQLTFAANDIFTVVDADKIPGWVVVRHDTTDKQGAVPQNYVKEYDPIEAEKQRLQKEQEEEAERLKAKAAAEFNPLTAPTTRTVVALYDFTAQYPEQLTITAGQQLDIIQAAKFPGWLHARHNEQQKHGLIPENYVEDSKIEAAAVAATSALSTPSHAASDKADHVLESKAEVSKVETPLTPQPAVNTSRVLYASHKFVAQDVEQLSFGIGEVLTVLEEHDDGWWLCRNSMQQEGFVPRPYLATSPPGSSATSPASSRQASTQQSAASTANNTPQHSRTATPSNLLSAVSTPSHGSAIHNYQANSQQSSPAHHQRIGSVGTTSQPTTPTTAAPSPANMRPIQPYQAVIIRQCQASNSTELSADVGQLVKITHHDGVSSMLRAHDPINEVTGNIPLKMAARILARCRATIDMRLNPYDPTSQQYLSFIRGDRILKIGQRDARLWIGFSNGKIGLFNADHVQEIPS